MKEHEHVPSEPQNAPEGSAQHRPNGQSPLATNAARGPEQDQGHLKAALTEYALERGESSQGRDQIMASERPSALPVQGQLIRLGARLVASATR